MATAHHDTAIPLWPLAATLAVTFLCVSAAVAQDSVSGAPSPSQDERIRLAERHHRAALAAFAKGRYRTAIARWMEADELRPSAAITFNVARSYEQLEDDANALAWYREYLDSDDRPSDHGSVTRRMEKLEKRLSRSGVQQITIRSVPSAASVSIDGEEVGSTPWHSRLPLGFHTLALNLAGHHQVSGRIDLRKDRALVVDLVLTRRTSVAPAGVSGPRVKTVTAPPGLKPLSSEARLTSARSRDVDDHSGMPPPAKSSTLTVLGFTALGAGAAALGGAVAFEVMRARAQDEAKGQATQVGFAASLETMRTRQTLARVFAGVGAGLIATGGIMLLLPTSADERPTGTRIAWACPNSRCGASVTGTF